MAKPKGNRRELEFPEAIKLAIEQKLLTTYVALPATVESYDPATQTCSARPSLKRPATLTHDPEELPIVNDVPVKWPRGGGNFLHMPLVKGDRLVLLFCDRSLDRWKEDGADADPSEASSRQHSLSDAVALVGMHPESEAVDIELHPGMDLDLVLGREDGTSEIHIKPDGTITMGPAAAPTLTIAPGGVFSIGNAATLALALATIIDANFAALKVAFDTHTHQYSPGPSPPAATGPASPSAPTPAPTGSTTAKVVS